MTSRLHVDCTWCVCVFVCVDVGAGVGVGVGLGVCVDRFSLAAIDSQSNNSLQELM